MIEDVPKVATTTMTIRIPTELLEHVTALASDETRSVNGQLVQLVKEALDKRRRIMNYT